MRAYNARSINTSNNIVNYTKTRKDEKLINNSSADPQLSFLLTYWHFGSW